MTLHTVSSVVKGFGTRKAIIILRFCLTLCVSLSVVKFFKKCYAFSPVPSRLQMLYSQQQYNLHG